MPWEEGMMMRRGAKATMDIKCQVSGCKSAATHKQELMQESADRREFLYLCSAHAQIVRRAYDETPHLPALSRFNPFGPVEDV